MKKYSLLIVTLIPSLVFACDICGCGAGNHYIGILPEFQKHIIGIRYRYNSMLTHVGTNGSISYLTTDEQYHTTEAWTGWNIGSRFRLMATVPYNIDRKNNQGTTYHKSGIGDVSASAFYQLYNSRKTVAGNRLLVQSLWLGAGIKLATGEYDPADKTGGGENANLFQLGTGSYDGMLSLMYDIRLQDAGLNINAQYKCNGNNVYDYRYGNKFSVSGQLYHKYRINRQWMIAPNLGWQYETSGADNDRGIGVSASGGYACSGTLGAELAIGNMALGANWQAPFSQDLASGIVKAKNRIMLHVALSL